MNKKYLISVLLMVFIIPIVAFFAEHIVKEMLLTFDLFTKWFIFSAIGIRLFVAGIWQSTKPDFTAKEIFHIDNRDSFPIVRELGFANICFGCMGIISLFKPEWRIVSAIIAGLYYAFSCIQHIVKKPVSANENFALWTDMIIFGVLFVYFIMAI